MCLYHLHLKEIKIIEQIQSIRTEWLDQIFITLNIFDSTLTYLVIAIFLMNFASSKIGFHFLSLEIIGNVLDNILKTLFKQPRPFNFVPDLKVANALDYGFPSGASIAITIACGFIFFLIKPQKVLLRTLVLLFIPLIGFTRVYLGDHFISDVIGGYCIGALILLLYYTVFAKISRWTKSLSKRDCLSLMGCFLLILFSLRTDLVEFAKLLVLFCALIAYLYVEEPQRKKGRLFVWISSLIGSYVVYLLYTAVMRGAIQPAIFPRKELLLIGLTVLMGLWMTSHRALLYKTRRVLKKK